jgi:hypothetical protein
MKQIVIALALVQIALSACNGGSGESGPQGDPGAAGVPGPRGEPGMPGTSMLGDLFISASAIGAVGDGIADDTPALVAMFSEMKRTGKPGQLSQGRYLIDCGALDWAMTGNAANIAGPTLYTSGKVVLVAKAGTANAPFISIHNDASRGGRLIHGGQLGAIEFEDTTTDAGAGRHGLNLYGVEAMDFGVMFSEHLKGDLIHIEKQGNATTADAWHVAFNHFRGGITWNTEGWTFNNDSASQVFTGNHISMLWNVAGKQGIFRGPGSNNTIDAVSTYACKGWALDLVPDVGTVQRLTISAAELDAPERAIRLDGVQLFDIGPLRITHRILPGQATAWPIVALELGGSTGTAVSNGKVSIQHRLSTSITADTFTKLGTFSTFSNANRVNNLTVEHAISYSAAGYVIADAALKENISPASVGVLVSVAAKTIHDSRIKHLAVASLPGTSTIATAGWGTEAAKVAFTNETTDDGKNYDVANAAYVIPYAGNYAVAATLMVATPTGTLMRIGVMRSRAGVDAVISERWTHASGSGPQSYSIELLGVPLLGGDHVFVIAEANGLATRPTIYPGSNVSGNNRFELHPLH